MLESVLSALVEAAVAEVLVLVETAVAEVVSALVEAASSSINRS